MIVGGRSIKRPNAITKCTGTVENYEQMPNMNRKVKVLNTVRVHLFSV